MSKRPAGDDAFSSQKNPRLEDRKATFVRHLKALNVQFAAWVQQECEQHAAELWTDGVRDYLEYSKKLISDYQDVLDAQNSSAGMELSGQGKGVSLGGFSSKDPSKGPPFLLAGSSSTQSGGSTTTFAALPSTGAAFSFNAAPAFTGFGTAPSSGAAGADEDEDEGDQQEAEEPSVSLEPSDAAILLQQRIKLMSMIEDSTGRRKWTDKGAGTLSLRRAKGAEATGQMPYLVFTTDSGRVLVNAPLVKGMRPTVNAKTPANLAMALITVMEGKQEQGMHTFKCDNVGAAKELRSKIEEFV